MYDMYDKYIYMNSFQKCSKCLIHHQLASPFTYEHRILASWYSWRSRGSHLRSLLLPWCYPEILMVEHIGSHHLGVSIPHGHFSYLGYFKFHEIVCSQYHRILYKYLPQKSNQSIPNLIKLHTKTSWFSIEHQPMFDWVLHEVNQRGFISPSKSTHFTDVPKRKSN